MNAKVLVVIAVIGLVAAIGAIALLPGQPDSPSAPPAPQGITLTLESISVSSASVRALHVELEFEATNPDPATVLLQYVKYVVSADGRRIHTGLIGERPEGFVASSNFVTLIEGRSVTLASEFAIPNTGADPEFWETLSADSVEWTVSAEASYSHSSMVAGGENLETFEFVRGPNVS